MAGKYTREEIIEGVKKGKSFEGCDLKGINLRDADLAGGKFRGANFRYTDLRGANLRGADLREANLRHVVFHGADLTGADLRGADLTHADLRGAVMIDVKLSGAKLEGAKGISKKVFFPDRMIEQLAEKNAININGDVVIVETKDGKKEYRIERAYRFIALEEGDDRSLIGKVKTKNELKDMNAEVFQNSVIIQNNVYQVETGFLGFPIEERIEEKREKEDVEEDLNLLSQLILKSR